MKHLRPHVRYGIYLLRHKWYVFLAGWKLGIPVLAALHDNSKFRPSEWFSYVNSFYGGERTPAIREAFDTAWLFHQKRNKHHWQFWLLVQDEEEAKVLPMPDRYRREMLADWIGVGRALGTSGVTDWYAANKHKMQLHAETRAWIEAQIEEG